MTHLRVLTLATIVASVLALSPAARPSASATNAYDHSRQTNSSDVTDASQLRLPYEAFGPDAEMTASSSVYASGAQSLALQGGLHAATYSALGMQGGWYEEADITPDDGTVTTYSYLGSFYSSTAQANGAFADAANQATGASRCSLGTSCIEFTTTFPGTSSDGNDSESALVRIFVLQNALFEAGVWDDAGDIPQEADTGLDSLASAFISSFSYRPATSTPTPVPASPTPVATPTATVTSVPALRTRDFSVWVRIQHNDAEPDWTQVKPGLTQVKAGSKVRLSVFVAVSRPHPDTVVHTLFRVAKNHHVVLQQDLPETMDPGPADTFLYQALLRLQSVGRYTFTGETLINGQSHTDTTTIVVLPRKVAAPPPVAFTFNRLQIVGARDGRSTFAPGDVVTINVTWTVRSVTGSVPVDIIFTPEIYADGEWHAFGRPTPHTFDTAAGQHYYSFGVPLPQGLTAKLKLGVGITIGAATRTRSAVIAFAS